MSFYPPVTQIGYSTVKRTDERIIEKRQQLNEVMEMMRNNIEKMSQRNDRLDNLASRAEVLDMSACEFHKCADKVKGKYDWKVTLAKYALGGITTVCLLFGFSIFFF